MLSINAATYNWRVYLLLGLAIIATGVWLAVAPLPWAALSLLVATFVALVLLHPALALYALAFAIPFGALFQVTISGISVGVTEALIGLMIASSVARSIASRKTRWTWPRLALPLAFFVGATLLSLLNVHSLPLAAKETTKWIQVLVVMTFAANLRSRSSVQRATLCLVLAGVAQALLGGYQFFTQSGPEFFALRGRFMRAYGTFEQPNPYGGYLGLVAPLALALGFPLLNDWRQALRHWRKRWLNWVALGSFVVISVAIGMSWSRGAWLGFGAALVVVSLAWSRRMALVSSIIILLAASTGLLGGFRLVPASITQRLTSFLPFVGVQDVRAIEITDENYASVERLAHWESALDMWRDHPWVGVGFGNYQAIYAEYALPKWPMALGHAHNYYLNVAAETGLLGIVTYLFFVGSAFWQTWQNIRHIQDPLIKATALGALGLLVHTSVHNLVDNLWVQNMYTHLAIVLGLAQSAVQAQTDPG